MCPEYGITSSLDVLALSYGGNNLSSERIPWHKDGDTVAYFLKSSQGFGWEELIELLLFHLILIVPVFQVVS